MKSLLTLSALILVAGYGLVEVATLNGAHFPTTLNAGNAFLAFTVVSFALVMVADYGRTIRPLVAVSRRVATRPVATRSIAAAHHHVYAIRRGAQAARLAQPSGTISYFPRRSAVRISRAA